MLVHDDPAVRIATGMRLVISLASRHPVVGAFMVRLGWPAGDRARLMLDFTRRDLESGLQIGRFTPMPSALALNIVSGSVISAIHSLLFDAGGPEFPAMATASALRALGVDADQAARIASAPLPAIEPVEGGLTARGIAHWAADDSQRAAQHAP